MFELPKEKIISTLTVPRAIVLFSRPKVGKTSALSYLEDNLIIDLEGGSSYVDAMKIDVREIARVNNIHPVIVLRQIIDKIKEENKAKGGYVYRRITLDTVTVLEDMCLYIAANIYRSKPLGKNWTGTDVRDLAKGQGYQYLRQAVETVLNEFKSLCETLILVGHLKTSMIDKDGKEMETNGLDLTGKIAKAVCADVDAVCYMYREGNETKINLAPSEGLEVGARPNHLKGVKTFTVTTSDENGDLTVDWSILFPKDN